jgi:hypothetical protein
MTIRFLYNKLIPYKLLHLFPTLILVLDKFTCFAQLPTVEVLYSKTSLHQDSSYYDIEKISANNYWCGGENGVLHRVDTFGNITPIKYPSKQVSILKIIYSNDYIYLFSEKGWVYRYTISSNVWLTKQFIGYEKKCFYNAVLMSNGTITVCGGTTKIARGAKRIPRGFIASINADLSTITTQWKSITRFAWCVTNSNNGDLIASVFNGFNSKIIEQNTHGFSTINKIKGLVYKINSTYNATHYIGGSALHLMKNGFLGNTLSNKVTIL